jgi:hypothetical protein
MNPSSNLQIEGLNSGTFIVPQNGTYNFDGKLTFPEQSEGATSTNPVVVTVTRNSSPVYTGNAGSQGFKTTILCSAGDNITITLSSSSPPNNYNRIRANVAIY